MYLNYIILWMVMAITCEGNVVLFDCLAYCNSSIFDYWNNVGTLPGTNILISRNVFALYKTLGNDLNIACDDFQYAPP